MKVYYVFDRVRGTCLLEAPQQVSHQRFGAGKGGGRIWQDGGPTPESNLGEITYHTQISQSHRCFCWFEHSNVIAAKVKESQSHRHTAHFTLHGKLCVLGMALRTKVSSQRQTRTTAAVQMTERHTHWEKHMMK